MLRLALLALFALPLAACGTDVSDEEVTEVDAAAELPDPDPDEALDVDPLSRQDAIIEDDLAVDSAETGEEVLPSMGDRIGPDAPQQ